MPNKSIAIIVTDKNEDIETITPADIWRRVGIEVDLISITGSKEITLANGIKIQADKLLEESEIDSYNAIYFPGGEGYSSYISRFDKDGDFIKMVKKEFVDNKEKYLLAMCASPDFLAKKDLILNRNATCYPGYQKGFDDTYKDLECCVHQNLITGRSPAAVIAFAIEVVANLVSKDKAKKVAEGIIYNRDDVEE